MSIFPSLHLNIERWKFNKDYGIYVSTMGHFKDRYKRDLPIKINESSYCLIETEQGYKLAHRLVMLTWKPIPDAENLTVDHLNHNKRDNSLQNLEWVTRKENLKRAHRDYIINPMTNQEIERELFVFDVNGKYCEGYSEAILACGEVNPGLPFSGICKILNDLMTGANHNGRKTKGNLKVAILNKYH